MSVEATLKVAVVQMCTTDDVAHNLEVASRLVDEAFVGGARWVSLPEVFGFIGSDPAMGRHASSLDDSLFLRPLSALAKRHQGFVLAGTVAESVSGQERSFNTSVLLGPSGERIVAYRKIHLFDASIPGRVSLCESSYSLAGDSLVLAEIAGWKIGLSVCYDLRFPEQYRTLRRRGAEILTVPSAFTAHTGKAHWDILLRARAVENQSYVVAPAQWGSHSTKRLSWGRSMIVDPWGTVLAQVGDEVGWAMAELSRERLVEIRTNMPCEDHRRL